MNKSVSRRAFVALFAAGATAFAATSALGEEDVPLVEEDAVSEDVEVVEEPDAEVEPEAEVVPEVEDDITELLPDDPTYEDFVEVVEEYPEVVPPDPGEMGDHLDV